MKTPTLTEHKICKWCHRLYVESQDEGDPDHFCSLVCRSQYDDWFNDND